MVDQSYDGHEMLGLVAAICKKQPATTTTTTIVNIKYLIGQYCGTDDEDCDDCPDGYETISTSTECALASDVLGLTWRHSIEKLDYTGGCLHHIYKEKGDTGSYFNTMVDESYDGHEMSGKLQQYARNNPRPPRAQQHYRNR
jgi:hypothetical protein